MASRGSERVPHHLKVVQTAVDIRANMTSHSPTLSNDKVSSVAGLTSNIYNNPVKVKAQTNATLMFTISNTCNSALLTVKVLVKTRNLPPTTLCLFRNTSDAPSSSRGCTYNERTSEYAATEHIEGLEVEFVLIATLENSRIFRKSVGIQHEECVRVKITNTPVITKERSNVFLAFTVSNKCGIDVSTVKVMVEEDTPPHTTACVFFHEHGTCIPSNGCTCGGKTGVYTVTKSMDGSEREFELIVKLANGQTFHTDVGVPHEQYAPQIESISLLFEGKTTKDPVPQNSSITIVCSWDKGYPPILLLPRLTDQYGHPLAVTHQKTSENEFRYTMDSVQCEDAGEIVCETEDGGSNMSLTLLVKCAPSITAAKKKSFKVSPVGSLFLQFPVRSHSTAIQQCKLSKETPLGKLIFNSCNSSDRSVSLTGSPPNLTLHFDIINVRAQHDGKYSLCLANDAGFGNPLTFVINVGIAEITQDTEGQTTPSSFDVQRINPDKVLEATKQASGNEGPYFNAQAVVVSCGIILTICVTLCVPWCIRKIVRGVTSRNLPPPAPHTFRRRAPDAVMFHVQNAVQDHRDSFISVHDHLYSEIPDEEESTPSENISASSESSTMSDSTFSNEHLSAIAIPSSDSSGLDDDLHARTSAVDSVSVPSWPSAPMTKSMARLEPPYENITPTFPERDNFPPSVVASPVSDSTIFNDQHASLVFPPSDSRDPDEHLHLHTSAVATTTDSITVDYLLSAATIRSEQPYENTMSTLPESKEASPVSNGFVSNNQPAAGEFPLSNNRVPETRIWPDTEADTDTVTVHSSRPALTMTTSTKSEPPYENTMPILREHGNTLPDDYLHPIASAAEAATPTVAAEPAGLSAKNSCTESKWEGTPNKNTVTLSKKTLNTLPDDYLHPIASPLEAVTSETVSTTKTQDKQSCATEETK